MKNKNIWLVLSGWGVNGFVYVGVMKYLEEKGIKPVIIWWTSVGSIFGALISAWYSWKEMENYVSDLENRMKWFKDVNWKNISKTTVTANINHTTWLIKWDKIKVEIWKLLEAKNIKTFLDLKTPFYLHTVNINTAEDVCVSSLSNQYKNKNVLEYIRASISIPWVFEPYEIDWKYFVDWWVRSNYPVLSLPKIAKENNIKIDKVLAINIFPEFSEEDNFHKESFLEILLRSISISILDQYDADTEVFVEKYKDIELINININKIFKNAILTAKITDAIDYWYNEIKRQLEVK